MKMTKLLPLKVYPFTLRHYEAVQYLAPHYLANKLYQIVAEFNMPSGTH